MSAFDIVMKVWDKNFHPEFILYLPLLCILFHKLKTVLTLHVLYRILAIRRRSYIGAGEGEATVQERHLLIQHAHETAHVQIAWSKVHVHVLPTEKECFVMLECVLLIKSHSVHRCSLTVFNDNLVASNLVVKICEMVGIAFVSVSMRCQKGGGSLLNIWSHGSSYSVLLEAVNFAIFGAISAHRDATNDERFLHNRHGDKISSIPNPLHSHNQILACTHGGLPGITLCIPKCT